MRPIVDRAVLQLIDAVTFAALSFGGGLKGLPGSIPSVASM